MPYRYLKAIDSYMVVKGFLNEINNVVKRQPIEMEQVYTRNLYCKFGCLTIAIGIAIGHYLRNRIKKTKKLSIKNIVRYMKRNKETLCIQKLQKRHTDYLVLKFFMNGLGIAILSFKTQSSQSLVFFTVSDLFALIQLTYQSYTKEQHHMTSILRFSGGLISFVAFLEALRK